MQIEIDKIKVEIKLSDKPNLKATVALGFGDLKIKGFRLSVSQHENERLENESLYLQPPSIRVGPGFMKIIFIESKDLWHAIEKKVYDEYKSLKPAASNASEDENFWDNPSIG